MKNRTPHMIQQFHCKAFFFFLKKVKTLIRKEIYAPHSVLCSITDDCPITEATKYPSTDERTKIMWYTHTMEYFSAIKKRMKSYCNNIHRCFQHVTNLTQNHLLFYIMTLNDILISDS